MELGQYQLQIFVGLMMIPGAAVVALILDSFKGDHRQLRDLALQLKTRRDDEGMLPTKPRTFMSVSAREKLTATDGTAPSDTDRISLSLRVPPKGAETGKSETGIADSRWVPSSMLRVSAPRSHAGAMRSMAPTIAEGRAAEIGVEVLKGTVEATTVTKPADLNDGGHSSHE